MGNLDVVQLVIGDKEVAFDMLVVSDGNRRKLHSYVICSNSVMYNLSVQLSPGFTVRLH